MGSSDFFGSDTPESDSAPPAAPPSPAPAAPPPSGVAAPTLDQAVAKAQAKANADVAVATDPHAVHGVNLLPAAPTALGAAATGALAGAAIGGPPGAAVGGLVMYVVEKYQIMGGPVGKIWKHVKTKILKVPTPAAGTPAAAAPAGGSTPAAG